MGLSVPSGYPPTKIMIRGEEPLDREDTEPFRALAEAYARIEYVEEHTNEHDARLDDSKAAICEAQDAMFDAEVDRALQELTDSDGVAE